MRILLVEDDQPLVEVLRAALTEQGYVVDVATDGKVGWELAEAIPYDLILLDVMLPGLDGISFCQQLRARQSQVLVMLLTARNTTIDKLSGLDSGADDYVVKPLNLPELIARIRALSRRGSTSASTVLNCGDLRLDPKMREVSYQGQVLAFSRTEYLLLELFLRYQTRVFSRSEIVDQLWSLDDEPPNENTIKSYIKTIRRKLQVVGISDWLETLYGQGYRINPIYLTSAHAASVPSSPVLSDKEGGSSLKQTLDSATARIWERTKGSSLKRIALLQQVVLSLRQMPSPQEFDRDTYQKAILAAHTLAGSLGTFGFERGSELARQLEGLLSRMAEFQQSASERECSIDQAIALVNALGQVVGEPRPLQAAVEASISGEALETPPSASSTPLSARVIAVDDDPQVLMVLEAVLEQQGVELTSLKGCSITQLWKTLKAVQPDLLILDITMPEVNGLQLCQAVRQNPEWGWLPILFLTACTDSAMLKQAFIEGADDYLTKPIAPDELAIRVANRLKRSQRLRGGSHLNT